MAISSRNIQNLHILLSSFSPNRNRFPQLSSRNLNFNSTTDFRFPVSRTSHSIELNYYRVQIQSCASIPKKSDNGGEDFRFSENLFGFVRSVFPGGDWWSLREHKQFEVEAANPSIVLVALCRMWELVSDDYLCRLTIFVAFGALIIAAISEISIPSILTASIFSAHSHENVVFSRNSKALVMLCFTSAICSGLRSGCFGIANTILVRKLREALYSAIVFQDISFFDKETVGDLTSRLGVDCQRLANVIGTDIHLITRNALQGTGALINLMMLSWPLALSALLICSILSTIFLVYGQYQMKAANLAQEFNACANEVAQESLSLVSTLRVYGTERKELQRYKHCLDKLAFINIRESMAYGIWNMSFHILYRSTQVFAVVLGGICIMSGHASAEQLTKYVLYCEWLIYATWRVTYNLSSLLQSISANEKVFKLINLMASDQFLSPGVKLQRVTGHIQFVDVTFHYPSREPLLECINMTIQPNEVVAIVGPSGSGKSTLVNLLLRLYEPINGQIYIDGFPLRELNVRWLRDNIGLVRQEPHLFHTDIRSNISYGCVRPFKQEDIEWAAKQACVHEFILSLPNGYDTLVDDNLLSGGQKQRIAISRAILRDPSILILDEATSALDSGSEHYIKEVLYAYKNRNRGQRTVIVIAHRLSTIKAADTIIVMNRGQVVEIGNHEELLLQNRLYAKLIKIQANALA